MKKFEANPGQSPKYGSIELLYKAINRCDMKGLYSRMDNLFWPAVEGKSRGKYESIASLVAYDHELSDAKQEKMICTVEQTDEQEKSGEVCVVFSRMKRGTTEKTESTQVVASRSMAIAELSGEIEGWEMEKARIISAQEAIWAARRSEGPHGNSDSEAPTASSSSATPN